MIADPNFVPGGGGYSSRAQTYQWDDGAGENNYRFNVIGEYAMLTQFAVVPGAELITSVSIAWGTGMNAVPARVCVWEDPNDDGNPTDAVLLAVKNIVGANAASNTFNEYMLDAPVRVTGKFFIGFVVTANTTQFPIRIDAQPSYVAGRLWYASGSPTLDLNNLGSATFPPNDWNASGGTLGYEMIRASGTNGGITYQGELKEADAPAAGPVDLRFQLFGSSVGGSQIGPTALATNVALVDGRFTVQLPFEGTMFDGNARWLAIEVAPAGSGSFTALSPRQPLTPAPMSHHSYTADRSLSADSASWSGLIGIPAGFADGIDNDSGGDITGVTAGAGLTGGATSGNASLAVSFAGDGVAATAARSDHTHNWSELLNIPAGFADGVDNDSGGDITGVTAGTGLIGGGASGGVALSANFAAAGGLNGAATTIARGDHLHSSLAASDGSPAAALQIDAAGFVGIGTAVPEASLHVRQFDLAIPAAALENDDLLVEADDAALGLYSSAAGSWGSAVALKEIDAGALVNTWGIARLTSSAGSSANILRFTFGPSDNYASNPYLMQIEPSGNVGIGTTSSLVDARLHVQSTNARVMKVDRYTSDGELVAWARDDSVIGSVSVAAGVVAYGAFTGVHYARLDSPMEAYTLVSMTGVNSILGGRAEGETVYGVTRSTKANDAAVLGVYLASLSGKDYNHPHDLAQIAAVGNGDLWLIDSGTGDIEPGDYLVSSDVPGCAMKDDPARYPVGHVFAIAAQRVNWNSVPSAAGGGKRIKAAVLFERFARGVKSDRIEELEERLGRLEALLGK